MKKSKIDTNSYIYDLNKTMSLNLELIDNILPTIHFKNINERKKIKEKLFSINNLVKKRINILKNKKDIQSKMLINSQIIEEEKRRKDENLALYEEKVEDIKNNINKKNILIKRFQKKYNDVEIYIRRECLNFPKWKKLFSEYEIITFLIENENLIRLKNELYKDIKNYDSYLNVLIKENIELKKRDECIFEENKLNNEGNDNINNNRYNELINEYNSKIKFLLNNISKLKNKLKIITYKYNKNINTNKNASLLSVEFIQNNYNPNLNDSIDEKNLNISNLTNTMYGTNISKISKKGNFWDISAISKLDI
jgi:hypothetical protein